MLDLSKKLLLAIGELDKQLQGKPYQQRLLKALGHHLRKDFNIFTPKPPQDWRVKEGWSKKGWYQLCETLDQLRIRSDKNYYLIIYAFAQGLEEFDPATRPPQEILLLFQKLCRIHCSLLVSMQMNRTHEFYSRREAA